VVYVSQKSKQRKSINNTRITSTLEIKGQNEKNSNTLLSDSDLSLIDNNAIKLLVKSPWVLACLLCVVTENTY
jgi:hypothetical protein